MKIAQIVCAYPPYAGGIGNSAYNLAKIFQENHEVETFHPDNSRPLLRYGHGAFIPQLLWKLKKFDLIYLHYPFFGTAEIIWLYKILHPKTKLIIHYHMDVIGLTPLAKLLSWPANLIRSSLLKKANLIISASLDYIKNSQIKNFYFKHETKFCEIPFGINCDKFKPTEDKINSNIKKILFVGGLDQAHYFKGVDILLNAVASLPEKNWELTIVGEGNLKNNYQKMAVDLKIEKQVKFLGKINSPDLPKIYQSADIFVLPSINSNEAFGIVLIEALACGVPVIASNLPGVRAVFNDKQEGLIIEPKNMADLKNKLELLLNNDELRENMSKVARKLALEKYDEVKIKEKIIDVLRQFEK
jgi:glycosyltransferase involved in cell wall biosynthesis